MMTDILTPPNLFRNHKSTDEQNGERVFDVLVNDHKFATNLDLFAVAGNRNAYIVDAVIQIVDVNALEIVISLLDLVENPQISAFEIYDVTGDPMFPQPHTTLINSGGMNDYFDFQQRRWLADQYFINGGDFADGSDAIANTVDDALYQIERNGVFTYVIPVPSGNLYTVTLHFCELFFTATGQRIFDVLIQNDMVLEDFDIVAAGGSNTAYTQTFANINVPDGLLTIEFKMADPIAADNPQVSAIQVVGP
jgi:large repetitive protein